MIPCRQCFRGAATKPIPASTAFVAPSDTPASGATISVLDRRDDGAFNGEIRVLKITSVTVRAPALRIASVHGSWSLRPGMRLISSVAASAHPRSWVPRGLDLAHFVVLGHR